MFNYDLPHDAEDYVHRIGRTARPARRRRDQPRLRAVRDGAAGIEAYIGQKIPVERIEPELLVAPPRRAGAPAHSASDDDDSADDARNTAGAPPKAATTRDGIRALAPNRKAAIAVVFVMTSRAPGAEAARAEAPSPRVEPRNVAESAARGPAN